MPPWIFSALIMWFIIQGICNMQNIHVWIHTHAYSYINAHTQSLLSIVFCHFILLFRESFLLCHPDWPKIHCGAQTFSNSWQSSCLSLSSAGTAGRSHHAMFIHYQLSPVYYLNHVYRHVFLACIIFFFFKKIWAPRQKSPNKIQLLKREENKIKN